MSQAWLGQRERGSIIAIRMLVGAALLLGRRVARLILYPVCLYFLVSDPKTRAASRKYLSKVLGRAPRFVDLFRHFLAFATVGLDRVYLLKDVPKARRISKLPRCAPSRKQPWARTPASPPRRFDSR